MNVDWNILIVAGFLFFMGFVMGVGMMTLIMMKKMMKAVDRKFMEMYDTWREENQF